MTIKEALKKLQVEYDKCPEESEHILMGIKALKKQLEVDLVEVYPYNLALDIYGNKWVESKERALNLSVRGIEKTLETLSPREKDILELRYKEKLTYEQIGKLHNITGESVRCSHSKSLRRLRYPSRLRQMKTYFHDDVYKNREEFKELERRNRELEKSIMFYTESKLSSDELGGLIRVIDVMETRLEDLGFSVRTYNCLSRANVINLKDITELTLKELQNIRNLGNKSSDEVINKLKEYGLQLKCSKQ